MPSAVDLGETSDRSPRTGHRVPASVRQRKKFRGNYWTGYYDNGRKEVTWSRVIEVPKSDGVACDVAVNRTDRVGNPRRGP